MRKAEYGDTDCYGNIAFECATLEFDSIAERDKAAEMVEAMQWLASQAVVHVSVYDGEWEVDMPSGGSEEATPWQAILAAKRQAESGNADKGAPRP